jgi:ketosteroid isomerase-like protein
MSQPAEVVRRYLGIVADLASTEADLRDLLDPDVRIVEHPNAINPRGTARGRDEAVAGFLAGKGLLSEQQIEIHELLESGDRVAVRATWRGTIAAASEALPTGTTLVAHIAAMLTVSDGKIVEHETFDCYEPFGPGT